MAVVKWEKDGSVALCLMNNGQNLQNLEFAQAMSRVLDEVVADTEVTAMVLTSTDEKFFSNGVDVAWMGERLAAQDFQAVKDFCYGMNDVFKKLLLLPVPAIAAINGHAFGNGAILSCACDFRFMKSDRGFFCFPEVDLGIPFLPGMDAFVAKAVPAWKFNEMKLTGRRAAAPELEEHHVIEKACDNAEHLREEVMAFARTFHKKRGIFAEHKRRSHRHILEIMDNEDPKVIEPLNLVVRE
ncbi:MAG: enoyl-CoA hydratase/isomerase family protein [Deltaproteobacteria bacterium]|nr:enoyl-CoA hydratase/isomerase family protein [Deltaproteobacteria bacterium]